MINLRRPHTPTATPCLRLKTGKDLISILFVRRAERSQYAPMYASDLQSLSWGAHAVGGILGCLSVGKAQMTIKARGIFGLTAITSLIVFVLVRPPTHRPWHASCLYSPGATRVLMPGVICCLGLFQAGLKWLPETRLPPAQRRVRCDFGGQRYEMGPCLSCSTAAQMSCHCLLHAMPLL